MKTTILAIAIGCLVAGSATAQDSCGSCASGGFCGSNAGVGDCSGPVTAPCIGLHGYAHRGRTFYEMAHDHYSPRPVYAYSHRGVDATRINTWNQEQAAANPWHCDYNYWRWGVPTALVVPPTATFQSEYNWGVAQTKSLPIYHQFGRTYEPSAGGGFQSTPYPPTGTYQFGIYPVRAPY